MIGLGSFVVKDPWIRNVCFMEFHWFSGGVYVDVILHMHLHF